jgi:hypothetical protein
MSTLNGDSADPNVPAVTGTNNANGKDPSTAGRGVEGNSATGIGVLGQSDSGVAVFGNSTGGAGVVGHSEHAEGVHGETKGNVAAIAAFNLDPGQGPGVWAHSDHGEGVHGETNSPVAAGVAGFNLNTGPGVFGESHGFDGVTGHSLSNAHAGVAGLNDHGGFGVYGRSSGSAGFFEGNVTVTGDIFLQNADCAEDFDIAALDGVEPGSVMVIGDDSGLRESDQPYDKRVAGVVSGGGDYKPGIVLDRHEPAENRKSIALLGKVYCKVAASQEPIEVGDLLTTSPIPGYAMKATDPVQAFGAVIGKALRPLRDGKGLIPILVALQ